MSGLSRAITPSHVTPRRSKIGGPELGRTCPSIITRMRTSGATPTSTPSKPCAATHTHRQHVVGEHAGEDRVLIAQLAEEWVGERRDTPSRLSGRGGRYDHQLLRLFDGQPLQ